MSSKKTIIQKSPVEKDETYFVSIKSPLELRRQILECTKKTIHSLQSYQKIILIRQQKIKEMENLKNSLKELMYLNKKLNEKLPEYNYNDVLGIEEREAQIEKVEKRPIGKPTVNIPSKLQPKIVPREKTELEKLEDSLASIEGKLKNLNRPGN